MWYISLKLMLYFCLLLCCKETSQGFNEGLHKQTKAVEDLNVTLELMYICILHMKVSVSSKEAFQFIVDFLILGRNLLICREAVQQMHVQRRVLNDGIIFKMSTIFSAS